jgi:eukaryotic-like serine/threonine-protein kinase
LANIYIDAVTKNNEAADVMANHFSEAWCDVLLGRDYETQGKYTQAEALDSQALEVQRRVSGPERSNTLSTMTSLGLMYHREAKYAQAEALLKQVLEIQRRVLGLEHPSTVRSLTNLVIDHQAQGNYPAANALARTALASSPSNPRFLGNVAWILVAAADPGQRRPAKHYHSRAAPFRQSQIMPTSTSCWAR